MKIEEDAYIITQIFFSVSKFFVILIVFALVGYFFTHPLMKKNDEMIKNKKLKALELIKTKKDLKKIETEVNRKKAHIKKNIFNIKAYKRDRKEFLDMFNKFSDMVKLYIDKIKESPKYYNRVTVTLKIKYLDEEDIQTAQQTIRQVITMFMKVDDLGVYLVDNTIKFIGEKEDRVTFDVYSKIKN